MTEENRPKGHNRFGRLRQGRKKKSSPYAYYCTKCGLVYLNNQASQKAANKPCKGDED